MEKFTSLNGMSFIKFVFRGDFPRLSISCCYGATDLTFPRGSSMADSVSITRPSSLEQMTKMWLHFSSLLKATNND